MNPLLFIFYYSADTNCNGRAPPIPVRSKRRKNYSTKTKKNTLWPPCWWIMLAHKTSRQFKTRDLSWNKGRFRCTRGEERTTSNEQQVVRGGVQQKISERSVTGLGNRLLQSLPIVCLLAGSNERMRRELRAHENFEPFFLFFLLWL